MSYNQYNQYGGNPYGGGDDRYGQSNPYGGDGGYGRSEGYSSNLPAAPPLNQQTSNYSQTSDYSQPGYGAPPAQTQQQPPSGGVTYGAPSALPAQPLSNQDFLARIEGARSDIRTLTTNISQIGTLHQRILSSPDNSASAQLNALTTQTQILNTQIKDQIKFLERDAARSRGNVTKDSQIRTLKNNFQDQLKKYQEEEQAYRQRYRDQIARQYRIVNPEATDAEVEQAADADWGDEGVFQTALKTNRSATASSVLGAVRARHNDIAKIETTLIELNQLFQDLAEAVILQEPQVQQAEEQTERVKQDTEAGNKQLDAGIVSARRARKLKWWCLFICIAIVAIIALVLGLYFGLRKNQ